MWQVETVEVTGAEPVTLAQAKEQLEVQSNDWDTLLTRLIRTARGEVERRTGQLLRAQTIVITFESFADPMMLPRAPIAAVTDLTYGATVIADFQFRTVLGIPTLRPALLSRWPSTLETVAVAATAGYPDGACPDALQHAILLLVADWFRDREATTTEVRGPLAVGLDALLSDFKISWC